MPDCLVRRRTIRCKGNGAEGGVTGVTTAGDQSRTGQPTPTDDDPGGFRRRLLDGLVASIIDVGYWETTVADIVRRAHTSRRTFSRRRFAELRRG